MHWTQTEKGKARLAEIKKERAMSGNKPKIKHPKKRGRPPKAKQSSSHEQKIRYLVTVMDDKQVRETLLHILLS